MAPQKTQPAAAEWRAADGSGERVAFPKLNMVELQKELTKESRRWAVTWEHDKILLFSPTIISLRAGTGVLVNKLQLSLLFHIRLALMSFLFLTIHKIQPLWMPQILE